MDNVVIHIGTPKTGTTALQRFLYLNSEKMEAAGFLYPKDLCHQEGPHYSVTWAIEDNDEKVKRKLVRIIKNTKAHTLVISSENFSAPRYQSPLAVGKTIGFFKDLGFKLKNIKVFVYLRRQDEYYESIYNERIKNHGVAMKIQQTVAPLDYYYLLGLWSEKVGRRNVIPRVYEKNKFIGGSIFSDFCDGVGYAMDGKEKLPVGDVNKKLSPYEVELFRMINRIPMDLEKRREMNDFIRWALSDYLTDEERDRSLLSKEEKEELLARYQGTNKLVEELYNINDKPIFTSVSDVNAAELSQERINELMAKVIVELWKSGKSAG